MKIIISLAIVGLFVATSFVSCKKDYTCICTSVTNGKKTTQSISIRDTKKQAAKACSSFQSTSDLMGESVTCALK